MPPDLPTTGRFVLDPEWGNLLVIAYFFLGGIAAGAYFTAALAQLLGVDHHREIIRTGKLIAFPLVLVCAVLLILDLDRPERFWHMVFQSERLLPMFKWWSPMSIGSWALLVFGAFTFASFLDALYDRGTRLPFGALMHRLHTGPLGALFNLVGSAFGFFIAAYTGVLLNTTNQPFWSDQSLLGALFLASGASTGVAAILLLLRRGRASEAAMDELAGFDRWVMILEIVLLIAFFLALGALALPVITSVYGIILLVGVLVVGLLIPLFLHGRGHTAAATVVAPLLVLVGGFLLRYSIVMMAHNVG